VRQSTDHILTTHSGSMVRPRPILQLMRDVELRRPVDDVTFYETVARAVAEAVEEQMRIGVDVVGDGEMGRLGFSRYIHERLGGLEPRKMDSDEDMFGWRRAEMEQFPDFYEVFDRSFRYWWMDPEFDMSELPNVPGNFERFRVTGPIHYRGNEAIQKEISRLKAALNDHEIADAFVTATVPSSAAGGVKDFLNCYPSFESFIYAVADACREEYEAIVAAGFILQLDYPYMARSDRNAELGIEALNYALRDIPETKIRLHYCTGSGLQPHTSNPTMRETIAPQILKAKAQAYGIEGASARHEHEWMVWKDIKLPEGKILIPGVIAQNYQVVEHPELVAWRIENFASVVGKENVIAGVDCGFSQFWDARRTTQDVQWAKLQSLVEGAAIASKRLWNK
jgi:5-methyltetrahydropteroyltriglutamate--homocysteine methyltransferase